MASLLRFSRRLRKSRSVASSTSPGLAEFPFAFLAAFGNKETTVRRLRKGESNASDVPGAVLQRQNIHLSVCESGMVGETLKALRESPKTALAKAKFILASDGETLEAEDLASGETIASGYRDFVRQPALRRAGPEHQNSAHQFPRH